MANNFKKVHIFKNRIAKCCIAECIVLKVAHVKLKIKRNLNKVHWETQCKYIGEMVTDFHKFFHSKIYQRKGKPSRS